MVITTVINVHREIKRSPIAGHKTGRVISQERSRLKGVKERMVWVWRCLTSNKTEGLKKECNMKGHRRFVVLELPETRIKKNKVVVYLRYLALHTFLRDQR